MPKQNMTDVKAWFQNPNEEENKAAPNALYMLGNVGLLAPRTPRIAIIGSRKASDRGLVFTRLLAEECACRGFVVMSGLAKGIDREAHEGSLAEVGTTIAVLGTSLDRVYPAEHFQLQQRISLEGLLVSQFPVGFPVRPENFPMRNRTMALLSHATVIVEASEKSGTRHQGEEALRLGRPLFFTEVDSGATNRDGV